LSYSRKHFMY